MHRCTIEEKVVIIYARVRPFVYLCMAPGESRDHFNHKGKSVLISPLQCSGWTDDAAGIFWHKRSWWCYKKMPDLNSPTWWWQKIVAFRMSNTFPCCTMSWNHLWAEFWPNGFHSFSSYSLWYSGSHSQQLWWLKHQSKMALLVWCEMKGGRDLGDLELQSMTSVFTNAVLWLGGLHCVIGLAASEEQVGWAGVCGSAWWGATRWRRRRRWGCAKWWHWW